MRQQRQHQPLRPSQPNGYSSPDEATAYWEQAEARDAARPRRYTKATNTCLVHRVPRARTA